MNDNWHGHGHILFNHLRLQQFREGKHIAEILKGLEGGGAVGDGVVGQGGLVVGGEGQGLPRDVLLHVGVEMLEGDVFVAGYAPGVVGGHDVQGGSAVGYFDQVSRCRRHLFYYGRSQIEDDFVKKIRYFEVKSYCYFRYSFCTRLF